MGAYKNIKFYVERSRRSAEVPNSSDGESDKIRQFVNWFGELSFHEVICLVYQINLSDLHLFLWSVTYEDIELKIKLYIQEKQTTFIQSQEILVLLAKSILGSGTNSSSSDTMQEKFKNLPVLNDVNQISNWFKGQQKNG